MSALSKVSNHLLLGFSDLHPLGKEFNTKRKGHNEQDQRWINKQPSHASNITFNSSTRFHSR